MISIFLIALLSEKPNGYSSKISKEWINFYSYSLSGFTPNKGQIVTNDANQVKEVIFYTRNKNLVAYITKRGISYVIYKGDSFSRVDYELIGANIDRNKVEYYNELPGYENYYLRHCPEGILFVRSYRKVVIRDVYENIDWIFRYDEFGNLHHEFILKKGSKIADIRIKIINAKINVKDKEVEMITPVGLIIDGNLVAYENERELNVNYKFEEDKVSFVVNGYTGNEDLVIDPQLAWSTYYGGSLYDNATSISTDRDNNVYVVGYTLSTDFPTYYLDSSKERVYFQERTYFQESNAGNYDVFILKFNDNGVRLWATYYGSNLHDYASSISIDKNNNVYVVGYTKSDNLPLYNLEENAFVLMYRYDPDHSEAFILKFNSEGVMIWSTYYGGNNYDYATSVCIDNNNNVYVAGRTKSSQFPNGEDMKPRENYAGGYDIFVLKFNSKGKKIWFKYYGGNSDEFVSSISVDNNNNIYIVGYTKSDSFPVYNLGGNAYFQQKKSNDYDVFIIKLDSNGTVLWSTYYGGNYRDYASSISIDKNNNIYVVGYTWSTDFPVYNPNKGAYFQEKKSNNHDAYIIKFNSKGERLWATYYGGSGDDKATSISIDNNNNLYVLGYTDSDNFPVYNPRGDLYFQGNNAGQNYNDVFILKFNDEGERLWATYYGGNYDDYAHSISIDKNSNVYITGYTWSTNFPFYDVGKDAYFQKAKDNNQHISDYNAFIIRFNSETKER